MQTRTEILFHERGWAASAVGLRITLYLLGPLLVLSGLTAVLAKGQPAAAVPLFVFLAITLLMLWTSWRMWQPSREICYNPRSGTIAFRVQSGRRRWPQPSVFPVSEWSIRVHPVRLRSLNQYGVPWHGYSAVAYLGPHRIPLICSARESRVRDYLDKLPEPLIRELSVDGTTITSSARTGGDLSG